VTVHRAVLFDMFDTLVRFDPERLPTVEIGGRRFRSSAGQLHALTRTIWPELSLATFYEAFVESFRDAERRRAQDHREIAATERFDLFYTRLGVDPESIPASLTARLLETHMICLAGAALPMPGAVDLLGWLEDRSRLAVVSNFDYTPTVHRILADVGLEGRFDTVVVSDAVGWRKPNRAIFDVALHRLGVAGEECLFIGDRPDIDVLGAKRMGMSAAWLNPGRSPLPEGMPAPDFDLPGLDALRPLLEKTS
jgi:HAD superfamily hydrolase (TIGR01509 family)